MNNSDVFTGVTISSWGGYVIVKQKKSKNQKDVNVGDKRSKNN
jgi:hypothetical protein